MKKEKFDKYTEYINAFKVAADELSKQNIDTNDNGIEIKKDKEGKDEPELTNGQKSLVWEADEQLEDKAKVLAEHLGVEVSDVEKGDYESSFKVYGTNFGVFTEQDKETDVYDNFIIGMLAKAYEKYKYVVDARFPIVTHLIDAEEIAVEDGKLVISLIGLADYAYSQQADSDFEHWLDWEVKKVGNYYIVPEYTL